MTVFPDELMVHTPGDMEFKLRTPGWHFGPGKDIQFKEPSAGGRVLPNGLFNRKAQNNPPPAAPDTVVIENNYDIRRQPPDAHRGRFPYSITVVKDDGSKTCTVDPVVVNN